MRAQALKAPSVALQGLGIAGDDGRSDSTRSPLIPLSLGGGGVSLLLSGRGISSGSHIVSAYTPCWRREGAFYTAGGDECVSSTLGLLWHRLHRIEYLPEGGDIDSPLSHCWQGWGQCALCGVRLA